MTTSMLPVLIFFGVVWIGLQIYKANRAHAKGYFGEKLLQAYLLRHLDRADYTVIHDVMLPLDDGTTTQIDHLVVSRFGIFVIEAKTYKGWIFGNARDPLWTVTLGRRRYRFQNPIRQNYLHVKTLSKRLGLPDSSFHSVVAFSGEAVFKTKMAPEVVHFGELPAYIKRLNDFERIPVAQLSEVLSSIRRWEKTVSVEQRRRHVENLRKTHRQDIK